MGIEVQDLRNFATEIAEEFNAGRIRHPVHLSDGNEEQLIRMFKDIKPIDWVCGGWRMHSQCLLHGVPREQLKDAIRSGHSMTLCFPGNRIISSAIVGGILPIATGIALQIKRDGGKERVHCWLGDMTAESGIFLECRKFAEFNDLPIRWIIEDNQVSVCTPTRDVWGYQGLWGEKDHVEYYQYKSKYPHAGAGKRVQF